MMISDSGLLFGPPCRMVRNKDSRSNKRASLRKIDKSHHLLVHVVIWL